MRNIREVLADRQLSWEQAQKLIREKEIKDILGEQEDEAYQDDFVMPGPQTTRAQNGQSPRPIPA